MNILRIISTMDPKRGGPSQGIRNSIPAMKVFGVNNEVVSFDEPEAGFLKADPFVIHAIGPAKGPYAYCAALEPWLKANIHRFDVVIIHGLWLYNSYGTFRAWRKARANNTVVPRLYVMPHGMLDPYFQRAKERKLKAVRNWVMWKLIEGKVVNNADGVLFTCEQELILARETFTPYHPKTELNVGYGIQAPPAFTEEMKQAFNSKHKTAGNKPYWLFLSRIHPKKGVDLLIKAYLELKKTSPNIPDLVIAGPDFDSPFGLEMQNLAAAEPSISFPGMLTGNAKWGALYGCECFILPSHQENFGISVVEAMACGKPVLISNQVNIWSEIQKENGGLIFGNNEDETLKVLQKWMGLPNEEKESIAVNARNVFTSKYTNAQAAKQMIDLISK